MSKQPSLFDAPPEPVDLLDVFPPATGNALSFSFDAMGWAEEAIAEAQERHPERAHLLDCAFTAIRPRYDLFHRHHHEHVVRSYMDELLSRVVEDGREADMGPGTATEGVVAMVEVALSAPLKHYAYVGMTVLFLDALGREKAVETFGEEQVRRAEIDREEQYKVVEFLDEVRQATRDEPRQRLWEEKLPEASEDVA